MEDEPFSPGEYKCGGSYPVNLKCVSEIEIPGALNLYSGIFLIVSAIAIILNGLMILYVLSKTPRKRRKRSQHWNKYAAKKPEFPTVKSGLKSKNI